LPKDARKTYEEMERDMWALIEGEGVEAVNAAVRTSKCLQLSNGAVYKEDGSWAVVHDEKIDALKSVVEEANGMPVLVAYNFKSDLARILAAVPGAKPLDDNPKTVVDWNAGRIPVLVAHPASAGHGLNLQDGGNILAFFGLNWNLEEHDQIIERIGPQRQKQSGYDRPVFIHYILARGTVDAMVLDRLVNKRSVQDVLLDAMRRRSET
jgi:SNF2 family DNA or RNA helicase